ncbi:MAG TPA: YciI family protein [Trebonia sp.]
MIYTLSYQMYKHEYGLSPAEQRATDVSAGEAAVAIRDLRLHLGRAFRRVRPVEQIAGYDVLECADLDEAIEIARGHPMARLGILEVRPFWPFEED